MSCSWAISWGDAFIKVVAVMTGVGAVVDEAIIDGLGGWCGRVDVAVAIFGVGREIFYGLQICWVRQVSESVKRQRRCCLGIGVLLVWGGCTLPCSV